MSLSGLGLDLLKNLFYRELPWTVCATGAVHLAARFSRLNINLEQDRRFTVIAATTYVLGKTFMDYMGKVKERPLQKKLSALAFIGLLTYGVYAANPAMTLKSMIKVSCIAGTAFFGPKYLSSYIKD